MSTTARTAATSATVLVLKGTAVAADGTEDDEAEGLRLYERLRAEAHTRVRTDLLREAAALA